MKSIILIVEASSCVGKLTARSLAMAGHTVYASLRDFSGRNTEVIRELRYFAAAHELDLRLLGLDVQSQASVDLAIDLIYRQEGRIDAVVHCADHAGIGPVEAFTPQEIADAFDINVLGPQRVNRAVLPHLRAQQFGLLLWTGGASSSQEHPPFMGPYAATKAAIDSLATDYAYEIARFGLETSIIITGVFTRRTLHSAFPTKPADEKRAAEYNGRYQEVLDAVRTRILSPVSDTSEIQATADEVTRVIGLPQGTRPFRTVVGCIADEEGNDQPARPTPTASLRSLRSKGIHVSNSVGCANREPQSATELPSPAHR